MKHCDCSQLYIDIYPIFVTNNNANRMTIIIILIFFVAAEAQSITATRNATNPVSKLVQRALLTSRMSYENNKLQAQFISTRGL